MKKLFYFGFVILTTTYSFPQGTKSLQPTTESPPTTEIYQEFSSENEDKGWNKRLSLTTMASNTESPFEEEDEDKGWNDRLSLFVGAGPSYITDIVYETPVIDRTTNNVQIELAGRVKPNVSLGIVYTPFVSTIIRTVTYLDVNGDEKEMKLFEYVPRGASAALFINPLSLATTNSSLSSTVDLGFGLGWRSSNFSIFATVEFFGLQQPRDYFIEKYKNNNLQFLVDGEIQTSIDINDNTIFKKEVFTALGVKLAYTFDIVKKYNTVVASGE